jgi:outer membrane protein insertion porin family
MRLTRIFLGCCALFLAAACNISRNVPKDQYLLVDNKVAFNNAHDGMTESEVKSVIRQQPNNKTLGMNLRLRVYNMVDTVPGPLLKPFMRTMEQKRLDRNTRNRDKNLVKLEKQNKINKKRIEKALEKGKEGYVPKVKKLKDTVNPRPFFREWLKYEFGEAPRIFDTISMNRSIEQIEIYLRRKGYFSGDVVSELLVTNKKKQLVQVNYLIDAGYPTIVDSLFLISGNPDVQLAFDLFKRENDYFLETPFRFDTDQIGKMRQELTRFFQDYGLYGFRDSYVTYEADTLGKAENMHLALIIAKRIVEKDGVSSIKPFAVTQVRNVYFHLADTINYRGNFMKDKGISGEADLLINNYIRTFDTLRYDWYSGKNPEFRTAYFTYNGRMLIKPEIIEFQNLLEENNQYRGYWFDQSFSRLVQTNLFQSVRPEIRENEDSSIDVHYYLVPSKKQTFSFEPRATNSNGFLGVSTSVNYTNKNVFGGGQKLKISFLGGFESQPLVFQDNVIDNNTNFNTLEYGPQIEFEVPGLLPIGLSRLSKRQSPRTIFSAAYNFQKRDDFARNMFQLNYGWRFSDVHRSQVFSISAPLVGGIQYVEVIKSEAFRERLEELNDLFLLNAYGNQFIWKDIKFSYQYSNPKIKEGDIVFTYGFNYDMAGMFLGLLMRNQPLNADGFKEFLGVRFSQFFRLDNELRLNQKLTKQRSMNYRLQIGSGLPIGNNAPNLPFDYSFFGGGSNDNRGFRARSLGPGVYKYYLDTNRTVTELGDMRFGGSVEYRFSFSKLVKGAFFADFGNIWTLKEDPTRIGGQISPDFWRQMSLSTGIGFRFDLDFLIFRLDFGIPLRNPALPSSAQWIFQSRQPYYDEGIAVFGNDYMRMLPLPFAPAVHIGIGYPF